MSRYAAGENRRERTRDVGMWNVLRNVHSSKGMAIGVQKNAYLAIVPLEMAVKREAEEDMQRQNESSDSNDDERTGPKIIAVSNGGEDEVELKGYDKWPHEVYVAFEQAVAAENVKHVRNRKSATFTFDAFIAGLRAIEAEYVEHFRDNAENAQQVRRIITEWLLLFAGLDPRFETSQSLWNELRQLGFYRIERECTDTLAFARACLKHGRLDLGLEVIAPVVAELERLRANPNATQWASEYYEQELGYFAKLRAELEEARSQQNVENPNNA
jgi:hypothetical protein